MKICYLGSGAWGFALTLLLAKKGYELNVWDKDKLLIKALKNEKIHPKFSHFSIPFVIIVLWFSVQWVTYQITKGISSRILFSLIAM